MFGIGHARLFLLLYACLLDTATGMLKKRKRAVLAVPKSPYLRPFELDFGGFRVQKGALQDTRAENADSCKI